MNGYLFPTPGRSLRKLLDHYAKSDERWPEHLCIQDIMLALDRDDVKPLSYYSSRWKRSKSWIHKHMPEFTEKAIAQRNFNSDTPQKERTARERKRTARERKSDLDTPKTANRERRENGKERRENGIEQITDTELHINNGTNVPVDKIDWMRRYREVMDSWNQFATANDLRKIRTLTDTRRKWIRSRYDKIWPEIQTIYTNLKASDYHMGRTDKFDGVTFETLWRNKEHYLKYIEMTPRNPSKSKIRTYDGPDSMELARLYAM